MSTSDTIEARIKLRALTARLRESLLAKEAPTQAFLDEVRGLIQIHALYVELISVLVALERVEAIPKYVTIMENIADAVAEETASLKPEDHVRALTVINSCIQDTYSIIRDMTSGHDATSVLLSQLDQLVKTANGEVIESELDRRLNAMSPEQKERVVAAARILAGRYAAGDGSESS